MKSNVDRRMEKEGLLGIFKITQVKSQVTQGREKENKGTGESVFIYVP